MDRRPGAGPRADRICGTPVVAIGDQNLGDALPRKLCQIFFVWRHRVDTEISVGMANEVAIKVVTMRFGKPRPGIDIG